MRVIFLDIDGVLNSGAYIKRLNDLFDRPENQMDPEAVQKLNRLTDLTGAKIVVSSTWRLAFLRQANGLDMLQRCMKAYGITGEVIGMTFNDAWGTDRRGQEIQDYLDNNPNIEKFVILDDDSDMGPLLPHLIQTKFDNGLQDTHVEQIAAILGTPLAGVRPPSV